MKIINKKSIYLLLLLVICLLGFVLMPTYAKFVDSFTTGEDAVGVSLVFDIGISNLEEYEELVIPAGGTERFHVEVTNRTGDVAYYGIWYKMVEPTTLEKGIQIGKLADSTVNTSGSLEDEKNVTVTIAIVNSTNRDVKINIGVGNSNIGVSDIEYLGGKYLITGSVDIPKDIVFTSIKIDGIMSESLPKSGIYTMISSCTRGSKLSWNTYNKNITYASGSKVGDKCSLEFTSSTEYSPLSDMVVGSYVAYNGIGGVVGETEVSCQIDGNSSSDVETDDTEAPNSCLGQNAREDLDNSNYTYGYCNNSDYKYYTTGWRIAYIDKSDLNNPKAVIVSAGAPECHKGVLSTGNLSYMAMANTKALKYCNKDYVDGDCTCVDSDADGFCDQASSDAWAFGDSDFYYMTKAISGVGKRLTNGSSSLGDDGGSLSDRSCDKKFSYRECGYHNDLIDNGGFYWFSASYSLNDTYGVLWDPEYRGVQNGNVTSNSYGLRPMISLSTSVYVVGGSGTMDDPYMIKVS